MFELNKILGALFASLLIIIAINTLVNSLTEVEHPERDAYVIEVEGEEEDTAVAEAPEEPQTAPIAARLANASAGDGERRFNACRACHTVAKDGANRVGPNLWDVVGAPVAAKEGFSYSSALESLQEPWTYANLDAWLEDPDAYAPGNQMTYAGLDDPQDRADLIAYMRSLSDDPEPLPEAPADDAATAPEEAADTAASPAEPAQEAAPAPAQDTANGEDETPPPAESGEETSAGEAADATADSALRQRIAAASAENGRSKAQLCIACHSVAEGAGHKIGPNLWGVINSEIAGQEGFSYSDALRNLDGRWTFETLDAYLKDPMAYAPGTRMAFPGVKNDADRAAVLAFLRSLANRPAPLDAGE